MWVGKRRYGIGLISWPRAREDETLIDTRVCTRGGPVAVTPSFVPVPARDGLG